MTSLQIHQVRGIIVRFLLQEIMMGKVTAYHPEIPVRKRDGSVVVIKPDLDDWYEEDEVLGKLLAANPGCGTMGELVEAIESGNGESSQVSNGVLSCCIEGVTGTAQQDARSWDERVPH
jgi:hypothetical protein